MIATELIQRLLSDWRRKKEEKKEEKKKRAGRRRMLCGAFPRCIAAIFKTPTASGDLAPPCAAEEIGGNQKKNGRARRGLNQTGSLRRFQHLFTSFSICIIASPHSSWRPRLTRGCCFDFKAALGDFSTIQLRFQTQ